MLLGEAIEPVDFTNLEGGLSDAFCSRSSGDDFPLLLGFELNILKHFIIEKQAVEP